MSLLKYKTNSDYETKGVCVEFDGFRINLARAGNLNKKFAATLERLMKPLKKAYQMGAVSNETLNDVLMRAYAESVVLAWDTKVDGQWFNGIEAPGNPNANEHGLIPFNADNVFETLKEYPDLWTEIQEFASRAQNYRDEDTSVTVGN